MRISLIVITERIFITERIVTTIQYTDGGGYNLLGTHTGHERHVEFPVEALRGKDWFYGLSHTSQIALFLLLLWGERCVVWKIL